MINPLLYPDIIPLADENGIDISVVYAVAEILGDTEDFDGLPITLEDYAFLF